MAKERIDKKDITIRAMQPEDIDIAIDIGRKITGANRAPTFAGSVAEDLGGEIDLSLIAEVKGKPAGFILARHAHMGEPMVEVGLIQVVAVDPEYRRHGIGSRLVNALLDLCKSRGLNTVRIMVREYDSQIQPLIEAQGFTKDKIVAYSKVL